MGCLIWIMLLQPQVQHYLFLSVCAVFSWIQTVVWLPAFGIFNVCMHVDTRNCTHGLYGHCNSQHGKLTSGRKIHCCIGQMHITGAEIFFQVQED